VTSPILPAWVAEGEAFYDSFLNKPDAQEQAQGGSRRDVATLTHVIRIDDTIIGFPNGNYILPVQYTTKFRYRLETRRCSPIEVSVYYRCFLAETNHRLSGFKHPVKRMKNVSPVSTALTDSSPVCVDTRARALPPQPSQSIPTSQAASRRGGVVRVNVAFSPVLSLQEP
jgi:hypothetical protein